MSATLNLGTDGQWGTKENSLLSYNDENGNYKPLPFDFTRASSATVVNKAGLIETVQSGIPRIDFLGNTNGALKLEPQRTNLVTYSEDFSNASWTKQAGLTPTYNTTETISPDGTYNATKFIGNGSAGVLTSGISVTGVAARSIYLKSIVGTVNVILKDPDQTITSKSLTVTTEWQRFDLAEDNGTSGQGIWISGIPVSGVYIFGAQLESSYPTSYIPTQGSTVTRVAETCSQTPPSGIIGQTEGTLFIDINISHVIGDEAIATINSGGYPNNTTFQRIGNVIQFVRNSTTQSGASVESSSVITAGRYKMAIAYKSGDTSFYLNGTQVSTTQTETFTNGTLTTLRLGGDAIGSLAIGDTYNQAQLYNTRLSNSELATLTSL